MRAGEHQVLAGGEPLVEAGVLGEHAGAAAHLVAVDRRDRGPSTGPCRASGRRTPLSRRTVVVLPAPFGPSSASTSPGVHLEGEAVERPTPLGNGRVRSRSDRRSSAVSAGAAVDGQSWLAGRPGALHRSPGAPAGAAMCWTAAREPGHDHRPPPRRRRRADQPGQDHHLRRAARAGRRRSGAGSSGSGLEPGDRVGDRLRQQLVLRRVVPRRARRRRWSPCRSTRSSPAPRARARARRHRRPGRDRRPAGRAAVGALDRAALPALEHVIASRGRRAPTARSPLDDLLDADPVAGRRPRADDDLAVLMFTSGTAGSPKAAMLTHGNLLANLEQVQAHPGRAQARRRRRASACCRCSTSSGSTSCSACRCTPGAPVLLVERFDPQSALEAIADARRHRHRRRARRCGRRGRRCPAPPADAFATVRLATSGAAKLDPRGAPSACSDRFGVDARRGLRPHRGVAGGHHRRSGADAPVGSIGVPLPGRRGAPGRRRRRRRAGRRRRRDLGAGPERVPGYWDDAEATAAALTADGWLRTGDIAVVDDDGYLFLVDRAKDLIIVSGFNVYPAEVEEVLLEHPAVARCAVVGVAHPHTGEAVKAYVVVAAGRSRRGGRRSSSYCAEPPRPLQVPAEGDVRRRDPAGPRRQGAAPRSRRSPR